MLQLCICIRHMRLIDCSESSLRLAKRKVVIISFSDITLHCIKHGLIINFLQGAHGGVSLHGWVEAQNNSMLSCQIFSQAQVVGSQVFALYGQCIAIILLPTYHCQYIILPIYFLLKLFALKFQRQSDYSPSSSPCLSSMLRGALYFLYLKEKHKMCMLICIQNSRTYVLQYEF